MPWRTFHGGCSIVSASADASTTLPGSASSIVLIGGRGMLGQAWQALLDAKGLRYRIADRPDIDLTGPTTLETIIDHDDALVINCAAWTDVDAAEAHPEQAHRVNDHGVGALARRCARVNATLLHYSTDYVFNGAASTPYRPDQPRDPINVYGQSKAEGERRIEDSGAEALIVRTSWLYAPWARNFVTTMAHLVSEKQALNVVNDQHGRPTSARHLAAASLALLQKRARGIYHVTDGGSCTWYELACFISGQLESTCHIEPCTSEAFPRPAPRPGYSALDLAKTETLLGPMPDWRDQVQSTLKRTETRV